MLITPCHTVHTEWNQYALHEHCTVSSQQLFIINAEHCIGHHCLTNAEMAALRSHSGVAKSATESNELAFSLELAVGMPILITHNLRTDLDITNDTHGVITNIILHPSENLPTHSQQVLRLQNLPLFLLIKLEHTHAPRFGSEDQTVIPISPIQLSFWLHLTENAKTVL